MGNKKIKKALSLFMAILMVVTMLPVTAIAAEIEELGCTHHLFHTEECGFSEGTPEVPCEHVCTEECGEACAHEHDEECGYAEAVPGSECTFHCEICEADIIYSDEVLYFSAESNLFDEASGNADITLVRDNAGKETTVTVIVYDNSANYGKDYYLSINGEMVPQIEGSASIYDLLRENGETVNAMETDANVAYGYAIAQESGSANVI